MSFPSIPGNPPPSPSRAWAPDEEKISVIVKSIQQGEFLAQRVRKKDLTVILGGNGSGKSTLVNYLFGCTMQRVSPSQMGLGGFRRVVRVNPTSECKEVAPIVHTANRLRSFLPQIIETRDGQFYCDCPGSGGFEIDLANAVTIGSMLRAAESVRIILLIDFNVLALDRYKNLRDLAQFASDFFGTEQDVSDHSESFLVGVTNFPSDDRSIIIHQLAELKAICNSVAEGSSTSQARVITCLSDRLFIYDPEDKGSHPDSGAMKREQLLRGIQQLRSIRGRYGVFHTVLPESVRGDLSKLADEIMTKMESAFRRNGGAMEAFNYLRSLEKLDLIDHMDVAGLINRGRDYVLGYFNGKMSQFRELSVKGAREKIEGCFKEIKQEWDYLDFDRVLQEEVYKLMSLEFGAGQAPMRLAEAREIVTRGKIELLIAMANQQAKDFEATLADNLTTLATQLSALKTKAMSSISQPASDSVVLKNQNAFIELMSRMNRLLVDSAKQTMKLAKEAATSNLESDQGVIFLMLEARKGEIDYLLEQLEICEKKQTHELDIFLALHTAEIERETQQFTTFLELREVSSKRADNAVRGKVAAGAQIVSQLQANRVLNEKQRQQKEAHRQKMRQLRQGVRASNCYDLDVNMRCDITEFLVYTLKSNRR